MKSRTRAYPRNRPSRPKGPWKNGEIPVIGIIGEIGGGKSRVAAIMAERGALVLDADAVGHALLTQRPVREEVVARFGTAILAPSTDPEGPSLIDRRALGAIVFAQPALLGDLETILHPRMRGTFERAIARSQRQGKVSAVVLDAAILFEAGWDSLCDLVLYVDAPRRQRLARLVETRGWTEEMLSARERAQSSAEVKRRQADAVIVNDAGLDRLTAEVNRFWETRIAAAAGRGGSSRSEGASPPRTDHPSNKNSSPSDHSASP
jgi:dephospho-CoA kinase